jgi:hypothetical protein
MKAKVNLQVPFEGLELVVLKKLIHKLLVAKFKKNKFLGWHFNLEMEKAKIQKWQIWRQILPDLPTYLHQISSDAAWPTYVPTYLPKNLTSYMNAP